MKKVIIKNFIDFRFRYLEGGRKDAEVEGEDDMEIELIAESDLKGEVN